DLTWFGTSPRRGLAQCSRGPDRELAARDPHPLRETVAVPTSEEIRQLVSRLGGADAIDVVGVRVDRHDLDRLRVPDTDAAREAERVAREACSTALLNHSIRSYAWGALLGIAEGRTFDAEVFYVR